MMSDTSPDRLMALAAAAAAASPAAQPAARRALRSALLAARDALPAAVRAAFDGRIATELEALLEGRLEALLEGRLEARPEARPETRLQAGRPHRPPPCIGMYWPMRAEPDLRGLMTAWHARGLVIALPQVVAPDQALTFVRWTPATRVADHRTGAVVLDAHEPVLPDLLLIPCVGFDGARYRLGYGGGFYDRTLAARPVPSWGVAYECQRFAALGAQAHDLPLDVIVTENGRY